MPEPPIEDIDPKSAVSRRTFIKGVIAAGAVADVRELPVPRRRRAARAASRAPGSVERLITLNVNGQARRVDVMKQETLAMTLRYKLGLTGTKLGCDRAECGACTVLIDDVPHYSCSVLTHTVRGRAGRHHRRPGRRPTATLHPVQQAVVDEQGFQCAFCMPGFVMAAVGFLKTNPNPTRAGAGARRLRQPLPLPGLRQDSHRADARRRVHAEGLTWLTDKLIGQNYTPPDLVAKVTGRASTPRTSAPTACCSASCCSARCRTRASARIDASAALAMPGVKAILTADDLPDLRRRRARR